MDSPESIKLLWQMMEDHQDEAKHHRETRPARDTETHPWTPEDDASTQETVGSIWAAVQRLEERQKAIYRLNVLTHQRIKEMLQLAVSVYILTQIVHWLIK